MGSQHLDQKTEFDQHPKSTPSIMLYTCIYKYAGMSMHVYVAAGVVTTMQIKINTFPAPHKVPFGPSSNHYFLSKVTTSLTSNNKDSFCLFFTLYKWKHTNVYSLGSSFISSAFISVRFIHTINTKIQFINMRLRDHKLSQII